MRSKAPLALMEQLVMVCVFALAAALCLQVFVFADRSSRWSQQRDQALITAQSAAEQIKSVHGDFALAAARYGGTWNGQLWGWSLDEDWSAGGESAYHVLVAPEESGVPLLGAAQVRVLTAEGEQLASLAVAWQEVDGDG